MKKTKIIKLLYVGVVSLFLLSTCGDIIYASNNTNGIYNLSREEIITAQTDKYNSNDLIRWDSYYQSEKDVHDGNIPVSLLDDPVYCSMNLPSESRSDFMIKARRDNGHIIGDTKNPKSQKLLSMGAIYLSTDKKLPQNFSVYLGKIKLFAYSKSKQNWITIDSQPYPCSVFLYELPWENHKAYKPEKVTKTNSYIKIDLTDKDMDSRVIHFWGKSVPLDKNDYLYFACAYEFWVSSSASGLFTATSGIDIKDATGANTIEQLYSSRGLTCVTTKKTQWGQTIPNSEYLKCNSSILNELYESDKTEIPNKNSNTKKEYSQSSTGEKNNATNKEDSNEKSNQDSSNKATEYNKISEDTEKKTSEEQEYTSKNSPDNNTEDSDKGNELVDDNDTRIDGNNNDISSNETSSIDAMSAVSNNTDNTKKKAIKPKTPTIKRIIPGKREFTVKWKKRVNNIKGYQIQYSTDQNFKRNVQTLKVKKSKISITVKKVNMKTKYYIRIRAYTKCGKCVLYSKWSKNKSIELH
ncbi:Fibronectin type III domain-containing protein [Butyrivibrio sp. ob235]|uniref:fibronectin type III domain-containing protein n=1 Tax=Butyrivibrio sp. ob235 TaxID=1761780 RepID=UPI0008D3F44D|nr:fibronectin type III domain-containing protein [Butyrivibrio sp. ob235]SEL48018.1 Fibronectin type III domain-containing protein [Butyrivibrio sp. ob235]